MEQFDETFLARWANNDLTDQELKAFESSPEYASYARLWNASSRFKAPDYPSNEIFDQINEKINRKVKVRKLLVNVSYGVAASVLILLSVLFFNASSEKTFVTDFGDQQSVLLPDGSEVLLNAKSSVTYDEDSWNESREVTLEGEAYFKVKKGSSFSVVSDQGSVYVLGTQFNVNASEDYFEVKCYTGKVKSINTFEKEVILTPGTGHRTFNGITSDLNFDPKESFWNSGQSSFYRTPLNQVIKALENQHEIKINNKEQYKSEIFTGKFSNSDLDLALKTVFDAMQIKYTINNQTVILSQK